MRKNYNKFFFFAAILIIILVACIIVVINMKDTYSYAYVEDIVPTNFSGSYTIPATGKSGSYKFADSIDANIGDKIIVKGEFGVLPEQNQYLYLFFSYAKLRATVAGEEVYTFDYNNEAADYLRTTGDLWHRIPIAVGTDTKDITLEFELVRKNYPLSIKGEYIASTMGLLDMHRQKNLIPFFLSLLVMLIGVVTVIFSIVFILTKYKAVSAACMGIAAIASGAWAACENDMITFFGISPANAYFMCLFSLCVIPIAFILYCILSYQLRLKWVLQVVAIINIAVLFLFLTLQLFGVVEMVSYIIIAQVFLNVATLSIIFILGYEYVKTKNKEILSFVLRLMILFVFGIVEVVNYYVSFNNVLANIYLIGFVIFYSWQFISIVSGLAKLVAQSVELTVYQNLAITDQLTGIRNRTAYCKAECAYNENIHNYSSIGVGMFDLNNLKGVNDVFGHSAGDKYIRDCTKIICTTFPNCSVFRIGGDEFVAVFVEMSESQIQACHQELLQKVEEHNNVQNIPIGIAFGYSFYNVLVDSVLNDVLERADVNMYINKKSIKEATNLVPIIK